MITDDKDLDLTHLYYYGQFYPNCTKYRLLHLGMMKNDMDLWVVAVSYQDNNQPGSMVYTRSLTQFKERFTRWPE